MHKSLDTKLAMSPITDACECKTFESSNDSGILDTVGHCRAQGDWKKAQWCFCFVVFLKVEDAGY